MNGIAAMALLAALPAAAQTRTIALKAARLFDGKSNTLQRPGVVVVSGAKITATGANAQVPPGAETIDLG
ncbi:MAG: metal-dependent hydrolase family protein, partial [Bryobacteraceae bacterium]